MYWDYIHKVLKCDSCYVHNGGVLLIDPSSVVRYLTNLGEYGTKFMNDMVGKSTLTPGNWMRDFLIALDKSNGKVDIFNVHAYDLKVELSTPIMGIDLINTNPVFDLSHYAAYLTLLS